MANGPRAGLQTEQKVDPQSVNYCGFSVVIGGFFVFVLFFCFVFAFVFCFYAMSWSEMEEKSHTLS